MRTAVLLSTVATLGALCLAIVSAGKALNSSEGAFVPSAEDASAAVLGEEAAGYDIYEPEALDGAFEIAADEPGRDYAQAASPTSPGLSVATAPEDDTGGSMYMRDGDADKVLYGPLATGAGTIKAMGYLIVIDGIEAVRLEEKCDFNGKSWPCGQRARTEFRAWMRDRALTCRVPPAPAARAVLTSCRIGNQDAGDWLVKYGWARALPTGPYVKAGEKARTDKLGIYGAPPALD